MVSGEGENDNVNNNKVSDTDKWERKREKKTFVTKLSQHRSVRKRVMA